MQYAQLFGHPDIPMSKVCPNKIQKCTILEGEKGQVGCKERYDMADGTFLEFTTTFVKSQDAKWKTKFTITDTSVPCFKDLVDCEFKDVFLCLPVTYCRCPWKQAIKDRQAKLSGEKGMSSTQTMVVWKTKISKACTPEQLSAIRMWKLSLVDDFTQDLQGNMCAYECKNKFEAAQMYIMQKTGKEDDQMKPSECPAKARTGGYTLNMFKSLLKSNQEDTKEKTCHISSTNEDK